VRLFGQATPTWNGPGVVSDKNADEVFFLLDSSLDIRDARTGGEYELLGLAHVQLRRESAVRQVLD
jgi:hypothetical protein